MVAFALTGNISGEATTLTGNNSAEAMRGALCGHNSHNLILPSEPGSILPSGAVDPMIGVWKFGPHHVLMKTPLSNIRLTTFFAGESEVKIIDPSRLSLVEAVGCQVEFIPPMDCATT